MDPLGIGIVGTGNIAGGYARDIPTHPSIRLVAATDLDPERRAAFGEAHGCRVHGSLDDLLADPEVDIVANLTVHGAHFEVTRRALEAGKHVYSEKPMALRAERGPRARRDRRTARRAPRMRPRDVPRRGPADGRGVDPRRPPGHDPRHLRRREPRPDRDLAPVARGVLRRRRARGRRGVPADAGHDDGGPRDVGAGVGLGPAGGSGDDRRAPVPHRQPRPHRGRGRARRAARSCG